MMQRAKVGGAKRKTPGVEPGVLEFVCDEVQLRVRVTAVL